MTRARLIVVGPLPPPVHGVTVSTHLILESEPLARRFQVEHLDTSDRRSISTVGRWDVLNVFLAFAHAIKLLRHLRGQRGIVYLPLSQGLAGFIRDSVLIHVSSYARWRVIVHLRGGEFPDFYSRLGWLGRWWVRKTFARIFAAGVLSTRLRLQFGGFLPLEKIRSVPNGTPDLAILRRARDGDPVVLFLSNLRRRKGVELALEAAHIVLELDPRVRFWFMGAWEESDLIDRFDDARERWGDRLVVLTPDYDKEDAYSAAAIFLFPPILPEGHPRAVLEAMSAGLPVVTTAQGAIPETVVDGDTGFVLVDPHPHDIAEKLLQLLADDELREEMGRRARLRYEQKFTQAQADARFAEWLEEVAR